MTVNTDQQLDYISLFKVSLCIHFIPYSLSLGSIIQSPVLTSSWWPWTVCHWEHGSIQTGTPSFLHHSLHPSARVYTVHSVFPLSQWVNTSTPAWGQSLPLCPGAHPIFLTQSYCSCNYFMSLLHRLLSPPARISKSRRRNSRQSLHLIERVVQTHYLPLPQLIFSWTHSTQVLVLAQNWNPFVKVTSDYYHCQNW